MANEKEFEINYVKTNDYKNYFSTGVIGGGTINGLIYSFINRDHCIGFNTWQIQVKYFDASS